MFFLKSEKTKNTYSQTLLSVICHTHTHTRLTALFRDFPGEPVPEGKTNLDFSEERQWVAVASAGLYASLHFAPER